VGRGEKMIEVGSGVGGGFDLRIYLC